MISDLPSDASAAARPSEVDAATLRTQCLEVLKSGDYTADEVAQKLGYSLLSIRPRVSELKKAAQVFATGQRRASSTGHSSTVWTISRRCVSA